MAKNMNSKASDARVEANRRNAKRSTGPKTAEGKRRSSANRTTHGAFASVLRPITQGPLAEDEATLNEYREGIVRGLRPQDPLEEAQAECVALAFIHQMRFARWQNEILRAESALSMTDQPMRRIEARAANEAKEKAMLAFTSGSLGEQEYLLVLSMARDAGLDLSWPEEELPYDERLAAAGLAHFGTPEAFSDWLVAQFRVTKLFDQMLEDKEWRELGERLLESTMPRITTMQQRLSRDVERQLAVCERLKDRGIVDADSTEA